MQKSFHKIHTVEIKGIFLIVLTKQFTTSREIPRCANSGTSRAWDLRNVIIGKPTDVISTLVLFAKLTIYILNEHFSFETRKIWIYRRSWYSEIKIFDASQTWYGRRFFWWTILFFLFKYILTIGHLTKLLAIMQTYEAQLFTSHIRRQKEQ